MEQIQYMAPCLFGMEGILGDELRRMGVEDVRPDTGRVFFSGGMELMAKVNIGSRFAERVLVVLGRFRAVTFDQLFEGVKALEWEKWIGRLDAFPVKGWSLNSGLFSVPDCQSIVKKAIVERLRSRYGVSWFQETGSLFQVQFSIFKDEVTVGIDTSGEGLHKRGYRPRANEAPIRETLAAAIADLARVRGYSRVIDPFCGSGTLLIESALIAMRIAPGLRRNFAAEKWACVPKELWQSARAEASDRIIRDNEFEALGYDIDPHALELTRLNASRAGVAGRIRVEQRDIEQFSDDGEKATVLCNPPYGERLLDVQEAERLYRAMGRVFVPKERYGYYVITPHEEFERLFGRRADKRRKLYNGMIRCQLYMYFR